MKKKTTTAWAVLGYYDRKPMTFGSLAKNYKGALSIFERRADAFRMARAEDGRMVWEVAKCEIEIIKK